MAEGNSSNGLSKPRLPLGDLTNRLGKRGFAIVEKVGFTNCNVDEKGKDSAKRLCVSPRPCTEINSLKGNVISGISKIPSENRLPNVAHVGSGSTVSKPRLDAKTDVKDGHQMKGDNTVTGKQKVNCGVKSGEDTISLNFNLMNALDVDSCEEIDYYEGHAVVELDRISAKNRIGPSLTDFGGGRSVNFIATEDDGSGKLKVSQEGLISGVSEVVAGNKFPNFEGNALECVDIGVIDDLDNSSPTDTSRTVSGNCVNDDKNCDVDEAEVAFFPESQESTVFGVDIPMELKKGNDCAYMSGGPVSDRNCSCSFCTKAAYIWLDLNYQDIKARISALKKSQKEAFILAERNSKGKAIGRHGSQSFDNGSHLESQLTYQWRSLFQHMANIWEEEGNRLEASLFPLTDLREKCKMDLESINGAPSKKC